MYIGTFSLLHLCGTLPLASGVFLLCKLVLAYLLKDSTIIDHAPRPSTVSYMAGVSLVKCLLSLLHVLAKRGDSHQWRKGYSFQERDDEKGLKDSLNPPNSSGQLLPLTIFDVIHYIAPLAASAFCFQVLTEGSNLTLTGQEMLIIMGALPTLALVIEYILMGRRYQAFSNTIMILGSIVLLQPLRPLLSPSNAFSSLFLAVALMALHLSMSQDYYRRVGLPLSQLNLLRFGAESTTLTLLALIWYSEPGTESWWASGASIVSVVLHGVIEYSSSIILSHGNLALLLALNTSPLLTKATSWVSQSSESPGIAITSIIVLTISIIGLGIQQPEEIERPQSQDQYHVVLPYFDRFGGLWRDLGPMRRRATVFELYTLILAALVATHPPANIILEPAQYRDILASPLFMDLSADTFLVSPSIMSKQCHRRRLVSHDYIDQHPHPPANETLAHYSQQFNNTLVVVFFSHARYDVNLDSYLEMYTPYFPNIIFVGPGNREDQGHRHVYDVVVDSYQSAEDLSDDLHYRMAGRMAHHMLYTVLKDHVSEEDCYDGYLWVPFDTFLNVPRLLQFDQQKVWYHSPFGVIVPNPALKNESMHAPPAKISPDPYGNVTEIWRHWGPDWWWGEPHFGLNVCITAFEKVPQHMRTQLASLTDNKTRFIGGSSDTIYFPSRYHNDLLELLDLFLDTNCFLEIALPTITHLILSPNDQIQFLDHWWIYNPPFNASFVQNQWEIGYEVDTFHTFHWGDIIDGVFQAYPGIIDEARKVMRLSFTRQGFR